MGVSTSVFSYFWQTFTTTAQEEDFKSSLEQAYVSGGAKSATATLSTESTASPGRRLNSGSLTFRVLYEYYTTDPGLLLALPTVTPAQIAAASGGALNATDLTVSPPTGAAFFVRLVGSADATALDAALTDLPNVTVTGISLVNAPPSAPPPAPPPAPPLYETNNKLIIGLVVGLFSFLAILVALRMFVIAPGASKKAKAEADESQTASNAVPADVELVSTDAPADTKESAQPSLLTSFGNMVHNVSNRFSLSESDSPAAATEKV